MKPRIDFFEVKESSSKGVKTIALKPRIDFLKLRSLVVKESRQ